MSQTLSSTVAGELARSCPVRVTISLNELCQAPRRRVSGRAMEFSTAARGDIGPPFGRRLRDLAELRPGVPVLSLS